MTDGGAERQRAERRDQERRPDDRDWAPAEVRRLRDHLGVTQGALAQRIGTKQQTISEWETGARRPRRMSRRLLHLVAEESGFYTTGDAIDEAQGGAQSEAHDGWAK